MLLYRLLILLFMLAFLVPRELNFRFAGISLCVTDVVFGIFLALWVTGQLLRGDLRIKRHGFNLAIFLFLFYAVLLVLIDPLFKGVQSKYFFFKDVYSFFTIILVWIIFNHFEVKRYSLESIVKLLFGLHTLLAAWAIMLAMFPPLTDWYLQKYSVLLKGAESIGYPNPAGEDISSTTNTGAIRIAALVGGFGNVAAISIFIPLYFACIKELKKWYGTIATYVALLLIVISVFKHQGRALLIALFISLLLLSLWRKGYIKYFFLSSIGFILWVIFGSGMVLIERFSLLKTQSGHDLRLIYHFFALQEIKKDVLLGIGMGNTFPVLHIDRIMLVDGDESLYLTLILKLGILGGLMLTILIFYLFWRGFKYLIRNKSQNSTLEYNFVLGMFLILTIFLFITGPIGYPFGPLSFDIIFWILMGFYAKTILLSDREGKLKCP